MGSTLLTTIGIIMIATVLYKYIKNNEITKSSISILIIGAVLSTCNLWNTIILSYGGMTATLINKIDKVDKKVDNLNLLMAEPIIAKIEISETLFDKQKAFEKINMSLLDSNQKPQAYIFKTQCEELITYKDSYRFQELQYKDKNANKMIFICEKAVELNQDKPLYKLMLAVAYHKNQNYTETVKILKNLEKIKYPVAQRKLAIMYLYGDLVMQDILTAKKLFLKAAENGDLVAQRIINEKLINF